MDFKKSFCFRFNLSSDDRISGLKTGMDFRGQVWKQENDIFGLK